MASTKAITTKIKSVQSTRKITKAMEMVSAAKMKRARSGEPIPPVRAPTALPATRLAWSKGAWYQPGPADTVA